MSSGGGAALAAMNLSSYSATATGAVVALKTGVVIPLALACLFLLLLFPSSAWRRKLSVPIYALLALASGALAFAAGVLAGARTVRGTAFGTLVSIVFFLLVAMATGCFLAMLFYRPPRDDEPVAANDGHEASTKSPNEPDR
jgi:hypothetical protein